MSCAADLSTMTDAEAHAACEQLRKLLLIRRLETFPATPAATDFPRAEAVGGGTFEQGVE